MEGGLKLQLVNGGGKNLSKIIVTFFHLGLYIV
jgi:hypothetical protein